LVDISTVSTVIAAVSVVVASIIAVLQLRDFVKTRQTELVMRLYAIFGSNEFQEEWHILMTDLDAKKYSYRDLVEKYGKEAPLAGPFFEGVGVLLHRKLIDIELTDDLFSGFIKRLWEKGKPMIDDARKQLNYPQYGEWFEYLYNQMKKREQKLTKTR